MLTRFARVMQFSCGSYDISMHLESLFGSCGFLCVAGKTISSKLIDIEFLGCGWLGKRFIIFRRAPLNLGFIYANAHHFPDGFFYFALGRFHWCKFFYLWIFKFILHMILKRMRHHVSFDAVCRIHIRFMYSITVYSQNFDLCSGFCVW